MTPNNSDTYLAGTIVIPSALEIAAITNANPMVVTATVDMATQANTYVVGQLVLLTVPYSYGMFQANQLTGQIIAINGLVFTLNIDSSQFDVFSIPSPATQGPASFSPAGSRNLTLNNNTLKVPFQNLNNVGN